MWNSGEVCCDVAHGESLESDADAERTLPANHIDEEEGADDGCDEFDDAEDGSCKELLVLAFSTEKSEELRSIDGDALGP